MAERDRLLADKDGELVASIHKMSLENVYKELKTSKEGLTSDQAKQIREISGLNNIPPPLSAPAWLCCLLPCLLRTKSMEQYNDCVPELGELKRRGKWVKMDSASIVPGDIIRVEAGMRVPADIRIIECSSTCVFETAYVNGKTDRLTADHNKNSENFLESPNMAFLGYLCTSGTCTGVVVATGPSTVVGKLLAKKQWPPKTA